MQFFGKFLNSHIRNTSRDDVTHTHTTSVTSIKNAQASEQSIKLMIIKFQSTRTHHVVNWKTPKMAT